MENNTLITFNGEVRNSERDTSLVDIVESMRVRAILTGRIDAVDVHNNYDCAILSHGTVKVIIPVSEMDMYGAEGRDPSITRRMLEKRIGATIDYVIIGIDEKSGVAVGSRSLGMKTRRRIFFGQTDSKGNKRVYPDCICEARVCAVGKTFLIVDFFGKEVFIRNTEVSYNRVVNLRTLYTPGDTVKVLVKSLEQDDVDDIKAVLSIKEATISPKKLAIKKYKEGAYCIGTVIQRTVSGTFVSFAVDDEGTTAVCLCLPSRQMSGANGVCTGTKVGFYLTKFDTSEDEPKIYGKIVDFYK